MDTEVKSTILGERTKEEAIRDIDAILERNADFVPRQINVSVSLFQKGVAGRHRGIPIAEDKRLYPEETIIVFFEPRA